MDPSTLSRLATTSSSAQQRRKPFSDRYRIVRVLGRGSYGTAYQVERTSRDGTVRQYVAKEFSLFRDDDGRFDDKRLQLARSESTLLAQLKHPNIVRYVDVVEEPDRIWLLMNYCEGGDLKSLLKQCAKSRTALEESRIVRWGFQLASALAYLHKHRVLHRDIKPANILLSSRSAVDSVLLADFGVSKVVAQSDEAMTKIGTPLYFSPEMTSGVPYSSKNDVWSLGVVLLEMMMLANPFDSNSHVGIFKKISTWQEPTVKTLRGMLPQDAAYSDDLLSVIAAMLQPNPSHRCTADDVRLHSVFDRERGGDDRKEGPRDPR